MAAKKPIESLSFEDALKELETIVRSLESGQSDLESAIAEFTRGNALKDHCAAKLQDAKLRIEKLTLSPQGSVTGSEEFAHESAPVSTTNA